MFKKCKVTVVKRVLEKQVIDEYLAEPEKMAVCNKMTEGKEFVIDNPYEMPEGICASAWANMERVPGSCHLLAECGCAPACDPSLPRSAAPVQRAARRPL